MKRKCVIIYIHEENQAHIMDDSQIPGLNLYNYIAIIWGSLSCHVAKYLNPSISKVHHNLLGCSYEYYQVYEPSATTHLSSGTRIKYKYTFINQCPCNFKVIHDISLLVPYLKPCTYLTVLLKLTPLDESCIRNSCWFVNDSYYGRWCFV